MQKIIQTQRLLVRKLTRGDAAFVLELLNTPGWLQYIGDRGVRSINDAQSYLEKGPLSSYEKNGYGLWLIALNETSEPIGMCGLLKRDYLQNPDIGFALLPSQAGKGYAHEAVEAVLHVALAQFEISRLDAICTPDNSRSEKLLLRTGFTLTGRIANEKGEELLLFSRPLTNSSVQ